MTEQTSTPGTSGDWDGDLDELVSGKVKKGPICTVALMLDMHPDKAKAARLAELIDDKSIVGTHLTPFVTKHGGPHPAKYSALMRHRKRACECSA